MDGSAAEHVGWARRSGAVLAALLAVGCLPFSYLATRGFVETYGLGGGTIQLLLAVGVILGTIAVGLALLSRRLVRRRSPSPVIVVVVGVALVGGSVTLGAVLGQRDWTQACEAGTVACEPENPGG